MGLKVKMLQLVLEDMLTKNEIIPGLDVWFGGFDYPENITNMLIDCLSVEEINRAKKFKHLYSYKRYIISRSITRWIIGSYIGKNPKEVEFTYNTYRKPYVDELLLKGIAFNLSHSHQLFCIAIGRVKKVGIDIEYMNPTFDYQLLTDFIFTENEKRLYLTLDKRKQREYFYELWVRKESYVKAIGKGLSCTMNSFEVLEQNSKLQVTTNLMENMKMQALFLHANYKAAVCFR